MWIASEGRAKRAEKEQIKRRVNTLRKRHARRAFLRVWESQYIQMQ